MAGTGWGRECGSAAAQIRPGCGPDAARLRPTAGLWRAAIGLKMGQAGRDRAGRERPAKRAAAAARSSGATGDPSRVARRGEKKRTWGGLGSHGDRRRGRGEGGGEGVQRARGGNAAGDGGSTGRVLGFRLCTGAMLTTAGAATRQRGAHAARPAHTQSGPPCAGRPLAAVVDSGEGGARLGSMDQGAVVDSGEEGGGDEGVGRHVEVPQARDIRERAEPVQRRQLVVSEAQRLQAPRHPPGPPPTHRRDPLVSVTPLVPEPPSV
jgi:hypothetical protein